MTDDGRTAQEAANFKRYRRWVRRSYAFHHTRMIAASYWTAGIAWAVMTALHGRWLLRSTHAGDVLSAYGAGLVVLGLLVAARPFLRAGLDATVSAAMPHRNRSFMRSDLDMAYERMADVIRRPEVRGDVLAERVIAVGVVVVGTLLNGWGTPLARRWGLPV